MGDQVVCNGSSLSAQEIEEFQEAVSKHIHVGNGYLCSGCDPLLACYCVAFNVNVVHDFLGSETTYTVPSPRRVVYLASSTGHMEHECNRDVEAAADVDDAQLLLQATTKKHGRRKKVVMEMSQMSVDVVE